MVMVRIVRPRARVRALSLIMEWLDPRYVAQTKYGPIEFYCPATWPYSRSDMAKEPDTNRWIEQFDDGDVFWDIGANVGVYSLYAARRGLKVCAFEPSAMNYFVLARNVQLNRFDDRIVFLNVAVSEHSKLDALYMSSTVIGAAQHQFGRPQDASTAIKRSSYGQENAFRQSVLGYSIDDLVTKLGLHFPNHIKVDVDGNEAEIIRGARTTLRDPRLKSVLIEIRPDERQNNITEELMSVGFALDQRDDMNHIFRRPAPG